MHFQGVSRLVGKGKYDQKGKIVREEMMKEGREEIRRRKQREDQRRRKGRQGNLVGNAVGFIWIAQWEVYSNLTYMPCISAHIQKSAAGKTRVNTAEHFS